MSDRGPDENISASWSLRGNQWFGRPQCPLTPTKQRERNSAIDKEERAGIGNTKDDEPQADVALHRTIDGVNTVTD